MKTGDKFTIRLYERPLNKDADTKFLMCPDCGLNNGITVKVGADTVLYHFPLYCRRCKGHFVTNYRDGIQVSIAG